MEVKISKKSGFQFVTISDLKEIIYYKDLLYMLVKREVSVLYKQTVLGFAWAIFRPLVQMLVFTIFFGKLLGVEKQIEGGLPYALFSYAALVPWTYFSVALNSSTNSLVTNSQFLTKVYFPRVIIPITPIISKLLDFFIAFTILVVLTFFYGVTPGLNFLFLPILILMMILTALGMSLWLSALATQYRDIQQLMTFFAQLLMYAAPVIWPLNIIPEEYVRAYATYPMVGVIEGFRAVVLNTAMPWDIVGIGFASASLLTVSGVIFFRNQEYKFADVV